MGRSHNFTRESFHSDLCGVLFGFSYLFSIGVESRFLYNSTFTLIITAQITNIKLHRLALHSPRGLAPRSPGSELKNRAGSIQAWSKVDLAVRRIIIRFSPGKGGKGEGQEHRCFTEKFVCLILLEMGYMFMKVDRGEWGSPQYGREGYSCVISSVF